MVYFTLSKYFTSMRFIFSETNVVYYQYKIEAATEYYLEQEYIYPLLKNKLIHKFGGSNTIPTFVQDDSTDFSSKTYSFSKD